MRLPDIVPTSRSALGWLGEQLSEWTTPTIRLGVTGLSRAGKTVFITALVRNLIGPRRMPFLAVASEGRLRRAFLEPQPDDELPRFAYERHIASLTAEDATWPESTRRISQLRLTLDIEPRSTFGGFWTSSKVHIDIIDYPGEWLLDLGLLPLTYEDWSDQVSARLARADHGAIGSNFRQALAGLPAGSETRFDEQAGERIAEIFTEYLRAAREKPPGLATLGPGRFLMPGDLAGSPMLTFVPMPAERRHECPVYDKEFARRFEAYKKRVVQPFFQMHFARLDRQVVLVDALSAINGGQDSLEDLRTALTAVLAAFKSGQSSWLGQWIGDLRIDKVLFAATKADHLPQESHDRLEKVLELLVSEAKARSSTVGAEVRSMALAAIRATQETRATVDGGDLACIKGVPIAGERIGGRVFDGRTQGAIFPGDLPDDPAAVLRSAGALTGAEPGAEVSRDGVDAAPLFVRFAPPELDDMDRAAAPRPWPHVRLDRAIEFLLGDRLP